jgi:uncharacterized delta-60 repeat protein
VRKDFMTKAALILLAGALLGLWPSVALGAPGDRDSSFGTGGMVSTDLGAEDIERGVTVDSVGRIVVVGDTEVSATEQEAIVVRYTEAGVLDPTFGGGDGIVRLHFDTGTWDDVAAVAIDGGDRIVIAGSTASDPGCNTYCYFAVARLTDSGQLDPTFGGDGTVVTTVTGGPWAMTIDGSGKILVGGDETILRFTESGELDPSFSGDGNATLTPGFLSLMGLAVDGQGRIVTAGYGSGSLVVAERLLNTGAPDPSFSGDGHAVTNIVPGSSDYVNTMTVDASDRVLAGGITFLPGSEIEGQPFIIRYTPSGDLDPSFDDDGIVLGNGEGQVSDIAVDQAGRYLVVGYADDLNLNGDLLLRYLSDGSLDPSFGGGAGFVTAPFGSGNDVTTDSTQRIVVAGNAYFADLDFAAGRYLGAADPSPSPPPPSPPSVTPPSVPEPQPEISSKCRQARARVVSLSGRLRHATSRRQRSRLRAKVRQARSTAASIC